MAQNKRRRFRRVKGALLAFGLALASMIATAAPAEADMSTMGVQGCSFSPPHYFCQTGALAAHPDHWIKVTVWAPQVGKVECSVYDSANWVRVGYVSRSASEVTYTVQTVSGLYASYFLICVNFDGYGAAQLSN
jgi:hypothetical protein